MLGRTYRSSDLEEIRSWYEKRSMTCIPDLLPPIGVIVPGIACGFIMRTDTKACILEPFIANPDALQGQRDEALTQILQTLVIKAKEFGCTHVFGFSSSPTMVKRALDQGFTLTSQSLTVVKELQ